MVTDTEPDSNRTFVLAAKKPFKFKGKMGSPVLVTPIEPEKKLNFEGQMEDEQDWHYEDTAKMGQSVLQ
jgi:hypothetical protein